MRDSGFEAPFAYVLDSIQRSQHFPLFLPSVGEALMSSTRPSPSPSLGSGTDRKHGVYRRLNDFFVGFWNETENWAQFNEDCRVLLEDIVNIKAKLNVPNREGEVVSRTKEEPEQMLAGPKQAHEGPEASYLSELERYKLNEALIRQSERLVEQMEAKFPKILRRMRSAVDKIPAVRSYVAAEASSPDSERFTALLNEASEAFPELVKCYEKELRAKREALMVLASFDDYYISLAVMSSWVQEAFVDLSLKVRAYDCASVFQ
uniref:Uncharacterized protein n=1 Tax=Steinernema glaseri TaxID=37863 RepID=A0A1I8AXI6_9BILA